MRPDRNLATIGVGWVVRNGDITRIAFRHFEKKIAHLGGRRVRWIERDVSVRVGPRPAANEPGLNEKVQR